MQTPKLKFWAFALLSFTTSSVFAQADITNLGGTVSAQYTDSPANETIVKLTDNTSATKYLTFHNAGWVQYAATQPYVVTKYSITSANDAPARDPKNWTLQGSANGTTWTTLNTQSNQVFAARFQRNEYTFANTIAYSQYRLNLTNNSGTILQLSEWELFGVVEVKDITNLPGVVTSQYSDSPGAEGISNVIDNSSATKFLTFHNSSWIQFQHGDPSVVSKYTLTSANDAEDRDPLSWTFQGSNDGTAWTTLDTRTNEDFPTRFLKKEYSFSNAISYTYYRLNATNNAGTVLQLAEWEILGTGGGGVIPLPTPPATWQEHWFDHNQIVTRVYYDNDLAVYFDNDVNRSITWMNTYIGDVWRYTKQTYGAFGSDPRLFAVFHTGRYSGGHPSTYFDASHDFRNVIDAGPGPWTSGAGNDLDLTTHEVAHIVEGAAKGVKNSPAFGIWRDSKWAEIFNYDVYNGLGRTADKNRWYNLMINNSDNFPRANTFWFRDWFYPIYNTYGGKVALNNYFTLLSQCFVKNGNSYARNLNMGEFIHFWSGAAGTNLKPLATNAFGWTAEYESQFRQAQISFPCVTYTNAAARVGEDVATEEVSIWYNMDAKVVTIADETTAVLNGDVSVYSLVGLNVLKAPLGNGTDVSTLDATPLSQGMYVVIVNSNGKTFRKNILVK